MADGNAKTHSPRTMTELGLRFLTALAGQAKSGVFLEIGPLFGSSTNAIAEGRKRDAAIHTIDTFEPAPWVQRRFGFDLSRAAFDRFTGDIANLVVHQGFSPNIVEHSWKELIGFYFDDASHGDPGWSRNFDFFRPHFAEDAILCGDDFANGWPDIIRNVRAIADQTGANLYVMGRVWAMCFGDPGGIEAAIDDTCPKLAGIRLKSFSRTSIETQKAACWSAGLHRPEPMDAFAIIPERSLEGECCLFSRGRLKNVVRHGSGPVPLDGIDQIYFSSSNDLKIQYSLLRTDGITHNSKYFHSGKMFTIPQGEAITAVRLSDG